MSQSSHINTNPYFCCEKYYPRMPYTHITYLIDMCTIQCSKPYDPANNNCGDLALCWFPCALLIDILCCIPFTFGCYTIEPPPQPTPTLN